MNLDPLAETHIEIPDQSTEHGFTLVTMRPGHGYGFPMSNNTVETNNGRSTIRGIVREDGAREFRGIKFASAARFCAPVDLEPDGSVDATAYGAISHQVPGFLEQALGLDSSSMSEDCLYLNVYVPEGAQAGSKLPVLFWIHGGAYTNGAGSLDWYHGANLAARGCVVVSVNYRLGLLGFLGTTNCGVLDMISALRWTNRHVADFGGNPDNITIFGESAGGSAVTALMAAPEARRYFHKVWAMSPSIGQLRTAGRADVILAEILTAAGCSTTDELADLPVEKILEVQNSLLTRESREFDWFAPTADGNVIDADLLGSAAECPFPYVVGTNRDENRLWAAFQPNADAVTDDQWLEHCRRVFGDGARPAKVVYESLRPGDSPHFLMSAVNSDTAFRARAWSIVDERCRRGNPTWMYWFTWPTPAFGGILGSCHALDIPFAFDNLDAPGGDTFTGSGPERGAIAQRFADELVDFATHGHPSWAMYDTDTRPTLRIDATVELLHDPESEIRQLFTAG